MSVLDSVLQSEQTFHEPLTNPEHCIKIYPFTYQYRLYMPEDVFGVYVHDSETGKTALILNRYHFDNGFELQRVHVVWAKMFEFHKEVLTGDIEPEDGEHLIWNYWDWRDCCTNLLPPPNARWIMPLPGSPPPNN